MKNLRSENVSVQLTVFVDIVEFSENESVREEGVEWVERDLWDWILLCLRKAHEPTVNLQNWVIPVEGL